MVFESAGLALLLLLPPQQQGPQQAPPAAAQAGEVILKLNSGKEMRGRVVAETPKYVELETGDGITVGLSRKQIVSMRPVRRSAAPKGKAAPRNPSPQPAASEPAAPLIGEEAAAARAAGKDLIYLSGGRLITGRIVKLDPGFVEIELAPGTIVGFERSKIERLDTARARGVVPAPRPAEHQPEHQPEPGPQPQAVTPAGAPPRRPLVAAPTPTQPPVEQPTVEQPEGAPGARRYDLIVLEDGEQMVGRILKDAGNYIEIQLAPGTVVGFDRGRVRQVRRAAQLMPSTQQALLRARDDWYMLHNGEGRAVGYLHSLIQIQDDASIRVSEEWLFFGKRKRTAVTVLETYGPQMRPLTCFYHERVMGPNDRLLSERLVTGEVQSSRLRVETRSLRGRQAKSYRFYPGSRFPLGYREMLRQQVASLDPEADQVIFDPGRGEFHAYRCDRVGTRRIKIGEEVRSVREITIREGRRRNIEWVDASSRLLRREVNGPALVALPSTRQLALRGHFGDSDRDSGLIVSGDGHLALWLPNPVWRRHGEPGNGQVNLVAPLYGATVTLVEMDQIEAGLPLDTAADAVLNWLRLATPGKLHLQQRTGVQVRRRPALRLDTSWTAAAAQDHAVMQAQTYVFELDGRYLALCCSAPRTAFGKLQQDFARILGSVQLDAQEIKPKPKGPLADYVR